MWMLGVLMVVLGWVSVPLPATARDRQAPTVTIRLPTAQSTFTTQTPTFTVAGTAKDNVRVTKVTWSTSRGASGTAQGTTGWSFPVTLPVGNTTVTVRAQDAAGHSRTDSLLVTVQALPLPGPITVQILQVSHPGDVIRIDRCLVPCGAMTAVASIPWSERQWIDQAIQPAQDYCYRAAVVAGPTVYPFSPVVCSP